MVDTVGSATPILDGAAWSEYCRTLERAGSIIIERSEREQLDRAEGLRYLSRMTRCGLERYVEFGDPLAPVLYRPVHETQKFGVDNPDSYYQMAALRGDCEYRIRGQRGTIHYLSLGTYYGDYGRPGRSGCGGLLEASQLQIDADGCFTLHLSQQEKPGNWLRMDPETTALIVRQNYLDRKNEEIAKLSIELVGQPSAPPPLDPANFAGALHSAGNFVVGTLEIFLKWAERWAKHPNELREHDVDVKQAAHGDPNIFFYMGYWTLGDDEALLIQADPPDCDYWNFQLCNHWLESLDYRYYRVAVNKHDAKYAQDGSFTLVISHQDPGVGNWIDTVGHRHGGMGLRWVKAAHHPKPRTRVVSLKSLIEEGLPGRIG
ncbi:MAG: DUF1214 domain-containing protein [Pseudomonadota bacterium]